MNKLRLSGILSDLGSEIGVQHSSFSISYSDDNGSDNGSNDNFDDNDDASFIQVDNVQPSNPSNSLSIKLNKYSCTYHIHYFVRRKAKKFYIS